MKVMGNKENMKWLWKNLKEDFKEKVIRFYWLRSFLRGLKMFDKCLLGRYKVK